MCVPEEAAARNVRLDQPLEKSWTDYSTLKKKLVNGAKKIGVFFRFEEIR